MGPSGLAPGLALTRPCPPAGMTRGTGPVTLAGGRLCAGQAYGFHLDGGPLRPDRPALQPNGVHGLPLWTTGLRWTTGLPARPKRACLLQLHVARTRLRALRRGIPRLAGWRAGVTAWRSCPCAFPGKRNWGYDGSPLCRAGAYGGPEGLESLRDAAPAWACRVPRRGLQHFGPRQLPVRFGP
jgi:hypothetical protein